MEIFQVSLPHYQEEKFLSRAIMRYAMYLKLQQDHPDKFLVPCYDMDIVWHTHQVNRNIHSANCLPQMYVCELHKCAKYL